MRYATDRETTGVAKILHPFLLIHDFFCPNITKNFKGKLKIKLKVFPSKIAVVNNTDKALTSSSVDYYIGTE